MTYSQNNAFERIEEYKAILDNASQMGMRRLNMNNLYVGINTIFLTALGVFLFSAHFNSWWYFGVAAAISLAIMPLNIFWRMTLESYITGLGIRYDYIREIEKEFRQRSGNESLGVYTIAKKIRPIGSRFRERFLAVYFLLLYPVIAIAAGVLTYLVTNHFIPPLP